MYVTVQQITTQLRQNVLLALIDDESTGELDLSTGSVQLERVELAIKTACTEVDSYISMQYELPLTPVPEIIQGKSLDIAIYNLYSRRGLDMESADKNIRLRYDDAVRWLGRISEGKLALPIDKPSVPPQEDPETISITTSPKRGW